MKDCNSVVNPVESSAMICQEEDNQLVDKILYRHMIGSLRYAYNSRLDIAYGVGLVSRFTKSPQHAYLAAVKRFLRYLKGIVGYGILFPSRSDKSNCKMVGYSDADWYGDESDKRSTTGYIFQLDNALVSWCSKKQDVVALSSR
ncbi:PREDICTED: uncharacterized protein LOC109333988 [Lupinus angustifolius]|uniref:uncharacterized protein LOC109333988 n=1 Tax=Lupinus angustifolius TaxID=3871 RepID=UPI00092F9E96|nr:PREDICTED: uncharacterized protein LOC109333988 [Lupinus angustifolius]